MRLTNNKLIPLAFALFCFACVSHAHATPVQVGNPSVDASSQPSKATNRPFLTGGIAETTIDTELKEYGLILATGKNGTPLMPMMVAEVRPGSPALRANIAQNDLLVGVSKRADGFFITVQRNGHLYRANLSEQQPELAPRLGQGDTKPAPTLSAKVTDETIRNRVRCFRKDLRISIGAGGSHFINSFNNLGVKHELLMALADKFAEAINKANLPPGTCNASVHISKAADRYSSRWNGNAAGFFSDVEVHVNPGHVDPDKAALDAIIDQRGMELAPLHIDIGLGGSHLTNSINNGGPSFFSFANFNDSRLSQVFPGGPLLGTPQGALRPTTIFFSIGGSNGTGCFDGFNDPIGGGTLQAVPPALIGGLSRPVEVSYQLGGSHFENSFNQNGSATLLTNEFLGRLVKQVKPSTIAGLGQLSFGWGGSHFENCAD